MTDQEIRNLIADWLDGVGLSNPEFLRQIRNGEQDDGPYIRAGMCARDRFAEMLTPSEEVTDE